MRLYKACAEKPIKKKMNWCETFIALLKGYCAISILIMPIGFLTVYQFNALDYQTIQIHSDISLQCSATISQMAGFFKKTKC